MTDLITERAMKFIEQNATGRSSSTSPTTRRTGPTRCPTSRRWRRERAPPTPATPRPARAPTTWRWSSRWTAASARSCARSIVCGCRQHDRRSSPTTTAASGSRTRPLFNRKWTVWEGGIRVPAIVRWPGRIPPGTSRPGRHHDGPVRVGPCRHRRAVPADARLEGINLFPMLEAKPRRRRTLFWRGGDRHQKAVRSGDWKIVIDQGRPLLFDLSKDIGERSDVIAGHRDVATRLQRALGAWQAEVDAEAKAKAHLSPGDDRARNGHSAVLVGLSCRRWRWPNARQPTGTTPRPIGS